MSETKDVYDLEPRCDCCGGRLLGDGYDEYLRDGEGGYCTGRLTIDRLTGEVLGCGAWTAAGHEAARHDAEGAEGAEDEEKEDGNW